MSAAGLKADVVLASACDGAPTITTLHVRLPRFVWAEMLTHRVLSRNARSSRAVPIARMIDEVEADPVVPWHWQANQRGMQGGEYLGRVAVANMERAWRAAAVDAAYSAKALADWGLHKQVVNRLLEPFLWIDALITGTEWGNFFALRDHPDAEPHIRDLAAMMRDAIEAASVQHLDPGDWHLPYLRDAERGEPVPWQRTLSAVRCARISYAPFGGQDTREAEEARARKLMGPPLHASAFEHPAMADPDGWHAKHHRNFRGWAQSRAFVEEEMSNVTA
ncbi:FAD-dependent thymidylate synthase [Profundibacterium mesophilum]|uniref:Thymidylate synthase complementing protein domain containing protein n=1 Tax=Profundibacterium mesophilum KAUST100406-0324 TaxID=1037889 RepID=A0A921TB87_9RHOB|nr:FAD-dependent thymidylate synthase [Profundibacterium mesophilum]KAF0675090.1 Thymidylate synthase complementing protein domain containing protein [Profundibacterium mesophilum KAUST100406-0324]